MKKHLIQRDISWLSFNARVLQEANDEEYFIVEPNIHEHNIFKLTDYNDAVEKADIIAILVSHNQFKNIEFHENQVILDFCGATN